MFGKETRSFKYISMFLTLVGVGSLIAGFVKGHVIPVLCLSPVWGVTKH